MDMKFQVEIVKRDIYIVEADSAEEAEQIAIDEKLPPFRADEVYEIQVERAM